MTLLRRYVFVRFVQSYVLTLGAFIGVFLIIDFFEHADEFVGAAVGWRDWLSYYVNRIPFTISYMGPQAVLLATVITLTSFARNNEFIAMKACGIGVTGITTPILMGSLIISFFVLASNEFLMPEATQKMNHIYRVKVRGKQSGSSVKRDNLWFRAANGAIWNVQYYEPEKTLMKNVSIFSYSGKHLIQQRIDATAAHWNGKEWEFLDGYVRTFHANGLANTEYFEKHIFPVEETPEDFIKVKKKPTEMGIRDIYEEIQQDIASGQDPTKKWVGLHQKISYPFCTIILALIGIPLSLRHNRSGGVLFCVSVSLAVGLSFSFFYAMGISLGNGGTFHPVLAAWGPIALFASVGFYLILTMDSEKLLPI